ncbi:hypothetical protein NE865_07536 [Phthorimaea operculella]|nr:hypothetical protein NE865_07536 [Phthorimaea operculella]
MEKQEKGHPKTYDKFCAVPMCENNINTAPDKIYFLMPRGTKIRQKWCKAMKRDIRLCSSDLYCCEDHFDIKKDTRNYIRYKLIALEHRHKTSLLLKKGVVPHKFQCQKKEKYQLQLDRKKNLESENDLMVKLEPILELEVSLNEPYSEEVHIDVKPDINYLNNSHATPQDSDTMFKPELQLKVKSEKNVDTGDPDTDDEEKKRASNLISQTCPHCGETFSRGSAYSLHMKSHGAESAVCDTESTVSDTETTVYDTESTVCDTESTVCDTKSVLINGETECNRCQNPLNLFRHLRYCTGPVSLTCTVCHQTFKSKKFLTSHMTVHSTEKPFECDLCGQRFKHNRRLFLATKDYMGPVSLTCTVCHQTFKSKKFLTSHMTVHSTEKPFECDLCGQRFKHNSTALSHRRRHIEKPKKKFRCSVCGKSFAVVNALEVHMRMHTKEKPFSCAVCMRAFSHKRNMQLHMKIHDKVIHLKCEVCQKDFTKESHLKYHMRVHYLNKKPYCCLICPKTYSHVQNITRHYKKKHPDHEYIAPMTDAEFANKAWEMHKNQNMEHSNSYILPESKEPDSITEEEEEILENPLPEPELVILDDNCIKLEAEEEIIC